MKSNALDMWSSMSYEVKAIENELTQWLDKYAIGVFDEDVQEEFIQEICSYVFNRSQKETKKHVNSLFSKTFNERVDKATPYAKNLGLSLIGDGL